MDGPNAPFPQPPSLHRQLHCPNLWSHLAFNKLVWPHTVWFAREVTPLEVKLQWPVPCVRCSEERLSFPGVWAPPSSPHGLT